MAKVSYIDLPPGLESVYKKGLQPGDRFTVSRVRIKDLFLSRSKIKGISARSQMQILSPVWAGLTDVDKAAWSAAGLASGLTGWKQFLQDTTERHKAGISGYATPNIIYQSKVGKMEIQSPATGLLIEQLHPLTYYIYKKVAGTRSQYTPVQITESFGFPLTLGISWRSSLTSTGAGTRARCYALIVSSYQGQDIETVLEIPFGLSDSWGRSTATLTSVRGPVQGYSVFIEVYNATGTLYFDNVQIEHTGQNWARDPDCNNIAQEFTKQYAQIPKHWAPVGITDGADFGSVYFYDSHDYSLDLLELETADNILTEATDDIALESYHT